MRLTFFALLMFLTIPSVARAQTPSAEQILSQFKPAHAVEYDTPTADEIANCKVEIERGNGTAGFVVFGPAGQVLRRFTDTNGDNKADLFRFYRMGLEVYRDIDADKNEKPDQHRWMNWGGMKWGVDQDEDGIIERWTVLSAPEAARTAIDAMVAGDASLLASVMITRQDVEAIRANNEISRKLLTAAQNIPGQMQKAMSASKTLTRNSRWVRFDPSVPCLIPKEDGKASVDLTVYENAMAIVENGETHELVSIGEMVKIGNTWKLCNVPTPLDAGNSQIQVGGILMQPELGSAQHGSRFADDEGSGRTVGDIAKDR